MNPKDFTDAFNKRVDPLFERPSANQKYESEDNKLKVVICESTKAYKKFIENHPHIDLVNAFAHGGEVILTYRGKLK